MKTIFQKLANYFGVRNLIHIGILILSMAIIYALTITFIFLTNDSSFEKLKLFEQRLNLFTWGVILSMLVLARKRHIKQTENDQKEA